MVSYLVIFGVLITGYFFCSFISSPLVQRQTVALFSFFFLWIILGLKSVAIGTDTTSYLNAYYSSKNLSFIQCFSQSMEPGYMLINRFFSSIQAPFLVFLIFVYLVISFNIVIFLLQFSADFQISFLFVFGMGYYFLSSAIRQSLAISFVLLGMVFLGAAYKKKSCLFWFLLCFLVSVSFHKTAFVFETIFFILFSFRKFHINPLLILPIYILVLVSCRPIYSFFVQFIDTTYGPKIDNGFPDTSILFLSFYYLSLLFTSENRFRWKVNSLFSTWPSASPAFFRPNSSLPCVNLSSPLGLDQTVDGVSICKNSIHFFSYNKKGEEWISLFRDLTFFSACVMAYVLVSGIFARFFYYGIAPTAIVISNSIQKQKSPAVRFFSKAVFIVLIEIYLLVQIKRSGYETFYFPYRFFWQ